MRAEHPEPLPSIPTSVSATSSSSSSSPRLPNSRRFNLLFSCYNNLLSRVLQKSKPVWTVEPPNALSFSHANPSKSLLSSLHQRPSSSMPAFGSWFIKAASPSRDSPAPIQPSSSSNISPSDLDSDAIFVDDDITTSPPDLTFSCGLSSPASSNSLSDHSKMQVSSASPIDIATPTRNSSSSPSSQAAQKANYIDQDSRASAIMSGATMDNGGMGRGVRQESFAGAKPISMNNPNRNLDARPRRESMANSLVGGMSWGGVSVGSWIRDEYVLPLCCTTTTVFPSLNNLYCDKSRVAAFGRACHCSHSKFIPEIYVWQN